MRILLIAVLLIFCVSLIQAQQNINGFWKNEVGMNAWDFRSLSDKDSKELINRWDEIYKSLENTPNKNEGTFYGEGELAGYFLRWSAEKGFVYVPYYDGTILCEFSYGKVTVTDSEITFIPEREIDKKSCPPYIQKTPLVWIPALGGKYLIEKDRIKDFGNFYGGRSDFEVAFGWNGKFFATRTETLARSSQKTTSIAPPKYLKFIKKPITAQIIKIDQKRVDKEFDIGGKEGASLTNVIINIGRKDGAKRGLLFLLEDNREVTDQYLEITRVDEKTSHGIVVRQVDKEGNESYHDFDRQRNEFIYKTFQPLKIGTRVTTSRIADF